MRKIQILARASLLISIFALHSFADDRYIVRVRSSSIDSVARQHRLRVDRKLSDDGAYLVGLPTDTPANVVVNALRSNSSVGSVEPNSDVKLPEVQGFSKQGRRRAPRL